MCKQKGLVVEIANKVHYDERTPDNKRNDAIEFRAYNERKGEFNMAKKHKLMEIDDLQEDFEGLAELEALIDKETFKSIGISSGAALLSGVGWTAAMNYLPDLDGKLNMLKAVAPAVAGVVGAIFLSKINKIGVPLACAVAASGVSLSAAFLASELLFKKGGKLGYHKGLDDYDDDDYSSLFGLLEGDDDMDFLVSDIGLNELVTPVSEFEDAEVDVYSGMEEADVEAGEEFEGFDEYEDDDDDLFS